MEIGKEKKYIIENEPVARINFNDAKEVIEDAIKNCDIAYTYWRNFYKQAEEDVLFLKGEQWDKNALRERREQGRPALTLNKFGQFVRRVVGDQKQNAHSITVIPTGDDIDQKLMNLTGTKKYSLAQVYEGIIRNIEYNSKALQHYKRAFQHAVESGIGWLRVITSYSKDTSFDLELKISSVLDRWSVLIDPDSKEPDFSDANYCFISEKLRKTEFEKKYGRKIPNSIDNSIASWFANNYDLTWWHDQDYIRVVEYFVRKPVKRKLLLLSNGETIWEDESKNIIDDLAEAGITVIKTRNVPTHKVYWYKMTAWEILEKKEWLGTEIPVIPVLGIEIDVKGRRHFKGLINDGKDAQVMHNYWLTQLTERVALAPKAPFIGSAKLFEGYEDKWEQANRKNFGYLPYNPQPNGERPIRIDPPTMPTAELNIAMLMMDEIKSSIGMYDASIGARGNEVSGRAIFQRQMQSELSNFVFIDNYKMAIERVGKILVELIPKVYDSTRIARIMLGDESWDFVEINKIITDVDTGKQYLINDLSVGKFDVIVSSGTNYKTIRQEISNKLLMLIQQYPQIMNIAPDILVKNLDLPEAHKLAKRLRKTLPKQLLTDEELKELEEDEARRPQPPSADLIMANAQMQMARAQTLQSEAAMTKAEAQKIKAIADLNEINTQNGDDKMRTMVREILAEELAKLFANMQNSNMGTQPAGMPSNNIGGQYARQNLSEE